MPNIATVFKQEISRVARKEMRGETSSLKKSASAHRSEIAALKRRVHTLEQMIRRLSKSHPARTSAEVAEPRSVPTRFSAKGFATRRRRLGLSAAECGLLVGASAQSIYNWEEGTVRPRAKHLHAIAQLRTFGKKEAAARLVSLKAGG